MNTMKIEIVSPNVVMRGNLEIIEGKPVFPSEKIDHPVDLIKLEPIGGTENDCFVFYNKEQQIIARGAIHNYHVENQLCISWENDDKAIKHYPDEVMKIWLNWLFANTTMDIVWVLLTGNYPEKEFLTKYFKEGQPPKDEKKKGQGGQWYNLRKEAWLSMIGNF